MSKMWWESVESFTADLSGANEARLLEMGTGPSSSKPRPIDADPEWIRWWSGSPVTTIELYPLPDGEVDVVSVYRESDRMRILGSSRALFACLEPASTREESERMLVEPPARRLFSTCSEPYSLGGPRLDLDPPPHLPATEPASAGSPTKSD